MKVSLRPISNKAKENKKVMYVFVKDDEILSSDEGGGIWSDMDRAYKYRDSKGWIGTPPLIRRVNI